jgi:hypothetical protein
MYQAKGAVNKRVSVSMMIRLDFGIWNVCVFKFLSSL